MIDTGIFRCFRELINCGNLGNLINCSLDWWPYIANCFPLIVAFLHLVLLLFLAVSEQSQLHCGAISLSFLLSLGSG